MPELTSLADHVELSTGFPFKSASYSQNENDVRLVRGDNVVQGALRWDNAARWPISLLKSTSEYELKPGDVVLAMDRPWIEAGLKYARIGAADTPSLLVQRVSRLRAKSQLDQGFLFYLIGSQGFTDHVLAIQTGTAVPHISGKQILSFEFPLLDLPEQRAIAAVLGSLDDKIEQNRRTGRKLEELARAVFKAWFVDFEPVKAKAAGATAFPGMPPETFATLPNTLKTSPSGPVPEGWEIGTVMDLCSSITSGGTPSRKVPRYWTGGTIDWFKTGELTDGPLLHSGEKITDEALANSSCKMWSPGTILFALYASPTVGRLGVLTHPGTSNQAAAGLVAKDEVGTQFLMHSLFVARDELQRIAVGAAQQNINQGVLKSHRLLIPPKTITGAFSTVAEPLFFNSRRPWQPNPPSSPPSATTCCRVC